MQSDRRNRKILILAPYPRNGAPGQRFRYEQYLDYLDENNFSYEYISFLDSETNSLLYKRGNLLNKATGVIKGFFSRFALFLKINKFDFIFLYREAAPLGPPIIEWFIAKVLKKRIIYDFDDAIWLPNTSENNKIVAGIKWHHKVASICKWAYKISCGNRYLCNYALNFNTNVILNPTTVDTENYHNSIKNQDSEEFVIGWTGTHSTMRYLNEIVPVLQRLEDKIKFKFLVISNKEPDFNIESLEFRLWKEESEIEDLLKFNIGLMPLTPDKWAEGKCGFKALQYMALGIPSLVSPVGVNTDIVTHGIDGYLCFTLVDWETYILRLYNDVVLREQMGKKARLKVEEQFSVKSNRNNFLSLFQ